MTSAHSSVVADLLELAGRLRKGDRGDFLSREALVCTQTIQHPLHRRVHEHMQYQFMRHTVLHVQSYIYVHVPGCTYQFIAALHH